MSDLILLYNEKKSVKKTKYVFVFFSQYIIIL